MSRSETSVPVVENPVDQQRLSEYQNRVSQWIGNQGLFFQLRYAKTIGTQSLFKNIGSLFVRLLIVLVFLVGLGYLLLVQYFASDGYQERITDQVTKAVGAENIEVVGFSRKRGSGGYRDLEITGGNSSFFFNAKLDDLSAPFGYLAGVTEDWSPETLKISAANLSLKAGGTEEEMSTAFSRVLDSLSGDGVTLIRIEDMSCDWGYSKLTHGRIEHTNFRAILEKSRWKVTIEGGRFWQNWLTHFDLEKAILFVDEDGIEVESVSLLLGSGRLNLSGKIGGPVETPEFDLKGSFSHLPLEKLIKVDGVNISEYIEGRISGSLAITGSPNRRVKISGEASLVDDDLITIRERWPLLKAISIIDNESTYRRTDFNEGSFHFSSEGGGMEVRDIKLLAKDKARLEGDFSTKLPTQQEAAKRLGITLTDGFTNGFTDKSSAQKLADDRMSLRSAAGGGGRIDEINLEDGFTKVFSEVGKKQLSAKSLEGLRLKEEMKIHGVSGQLKLAVPKSAFRDNANLSFLYPADSNDWRWIPMNLATTFIGISEEANDKILDQNRVRIERVE
jgi:hypothetical protein